MKTIRDYTRERLFDNNIAEQVGFAISCEISAYEYCYRVVI